MIHRIISDLLEDRLGHYPAVALLGARQIGKTTLALQMAAARPSVYLDLQSHKDLAQLDDALAFMQANSDKLIILDEVQLKPQLFMTLRGVIDRNRREGRRNGQFLILGSASMNLLRQSSESLAGRISYVELSGINVLETDAWNERLWLRGGFPDSFLSPADKRSMEWLDMLIRTYLERDIVQLGFNVPAPRMRRLWTMLAHLHGTTVNHSTLAGNLEVSSKTITSNIDILCSMLLLRRLQPWHANISKRLVKSPRIYIRDSGILHTLLDIYSHNDLISHPVLGKSWEGFVIENIHSILPITVQPFYYRTAAGAEIDLVLKFSSREVWAIEIKHGSTPKLSTGFHTAAADISANRKFVIYGGTDTFPMARKTMAMPLPAFMQEVQKQISL